MRGLRVLSYGGGVQSTALLTMIASGDLHADAVLFCDVGEDSEAPGTVAYVRDVAQPYAERHGIRFEVLRRTRRDGTTETVYQRAMGQTRTVPIPVRMSNGAPGNRTCTVDWKVDPVQKWTKAHGATVSDPATVILGISVDEAHRARASLSCAWQVPEYPLLDRRLTRAGCIGVIERAGLPVPPKSACWFCPFHTPAMWRAMRREAPGMFDAAADLEERLNAKRAALGRDQVWLTRFGKPIREAIPLDGQLSLDGFDACEEGWCWT